jgi:anti-sigma factor RsiW
MSRSPSPPRRRSTDCRKQLDELFGYLDGELTAARRAAIERHLASCGCCTRLALDLRHAIAVCRAAGRDRLPRFVTQGARRRAAALLQQPAAAAPRARAAEPTNVTKRKSSKH